MDEWVWSNGGLILTGKIEVLREKYYTVRLVDERMCMEQWCDDAYGDIEVLGEKYYSVGGRWMSVYGAMVEWYWQGKLKSCEKNIIQLFW